jgi:hypothetical protein
MITARIILKRDLVRGAEINDAVAMEFGGGESDMGAMRVGSELGVDVHGAAAFAADHARRSISDDPVPILEARHEVAQAFVLGVLTTLRTITLMERR